MVYSAEAAVKGISVARDNIVVVVVDDFRDVTVVDLDDVGIDYEMGEGATVGKTSENKKICNIQLLKKVLHTDINYWLSPSI